MGGHAFAHLDTPRIPKELYLRTREITHKALRKIFKYVAVPTEMPSKPGKEHCIILTLPLPFQLFLINFRINRFAYLDFGDVDFLVAGPLTVGPSLHFDYQHHVSVINDAFKTVHGRKGVITEQMMFFAIPSPDPETDFFIQIDVKVCERPELFEWMHFQTVYASVGKIIGSE